jgi:L,D-transpeptidase catalytic domain
MACLQISTAEISAPTRGVGFRDLFHLLPLVRGGAWTVPLSTVSDHVSGRVPLCLSLFIRELLAKNQFWQLTYDRRNSRVTKFELSSNRVRMRCLLAVLFSLISLASVLPAAQIEPASRLIISVREQKLMLLQDGAKLATYPVSTSKFGLGDFLGRMTTPLGYFAVAQKIGDHAPTGAVFHNRRFTGEILPPNAAGRDPVVTRIIWLRGLEPQNAHAFSRCIYIHGTPEEKTIGQPASYGCIRMKSSDVTALYNQIPLGAIVQIIPDRLPKVRKVPAVPSSITLMAQAEQTEQTRTEEQLASTTDSGSLTIEQMRMAGALAGERQKAQARKVTPVQNKGVVTAQNSPRA